MVIWRIRSVDSVMPPSTPDDPPDRLVPPPRGTTGTLCPLAHRSMAWTSAVLVARTTASGTAGVGVASPVLSVAGHQVRVGEHGVGGEGVDEVPAATCSPSCTRIPRKWDASPLGIRRDCRSWAMWTSLGVGHALPDGRLLLHDASFRVGEGAKAALVGANGAGKTTLLRLIAGDEPTADGDDRARRRPGRDAPVHRLGARRDHRAGLPGPARRARASRGLGRHCRPASWC